MAQYIGDASKQESLPRMVTMGGHNYEIASLFLCYPDDCCGHFPRAHRGAHRYILHAQALLGLVEAALRLLMLLGERVAGVSVNDAQKVNLGTQFWDDIFDHLPCGVVDGRAVQRPENLADHL